MRAVVLLSFLCGFAFADGGSISTCDIDHTTDTVTTTTWKVKVTKVRRNGVVVTSGNYNLIGSGQDPHPISDFGQFILYPYYPSISRPWTGVVLGGGGIDNLPLYIQ